jgi:diguanylate cyclase (GGDEF)-like protein
MLVRRSHRNNGKRAGSLTICPPNPPSNKVSNTVSNHQCASLDEGKGLSERDLEGLLSSALLASDKELGGIVREIDEIAKALRLQAADPQALRVAVHPAVWSAVRHVIVERELRYLALTDDLTCLYNRRGFFAAATQQLKLARRNSQSSLLLFCDVDNLKKINDSFGHKEGDLALVRTADALEEAFRDSDILARLAGDEFAVLVVEASNEDEAVILSRLEKALKKSNAGESRYELSLSVGVARFDPQNAVSLGELMEQADRDMYEQKRRRPGRCLSQA